MQLDQENLALADIVIRPQVGDVSTIDFDRSAELIKEGEDAARAALTNIKVQTINKTKGGYLFE
jgi:predicted acylesterase/phospholipase RssA